MTVILILLCLAIAGRELYLAFDRKRLAPPVELVVVKRELEAQKSARAALEEWKSATQERIRLLESVQAGEGESLQGTDARIRSLVAQINERVLPEVNARLGRHQADLDRVQAELRLLRGQLVRRLDLAAAASLGDEPVDTVRGLLSGAVAGSTQPLVQAYERCADLYGLEIELADPAPENDPLWRVRYYLSGMSPRELERDFLDLLKALRAGGADLPATASAARPLLSELHKLTDGTAQLGPLLIVRTPGELICGVLPLAELRRTDLTDPAAHLRTLPPTRHCDLSSWPHRALTA